MQKDRVSDKKTSLKILELVAVRGKGGTGASVVNLALKMAEMGASVDVVCFRRSDVYKKLSGRPEVRVITGIRMPRSFKPFSFIRDLVKLIGLVKLRKYHVIHCHSSPDAALGCFLKIFFPGIRLVATRHVPLGFGFESKWKFFDQVIASSFAVFKKLGDLRFKAFVIYDGLENFEIKDVKTRKPVVGCISRYSKVKGIPFFVLALKELSKRWRFYAFVAGRTRKKEGSKPIDELRDLCRRLKVSVDLMGFTDDVGKLYGMSDAICLSSLGSEGSSRVGIETFFSARVLVASRVGALTELVEHGKTGFSFDPADFRGLSEALDAIFRVPRLKKILGRNARRKAERKFNLERNVQVFLKSVKGS